MMSWIMITSIDRMNEEEEMPCSSAYLSQARRVQLAIIKSESIKTSRTVPGQMVINVFSTNLVLNLIRLKAPILLDEASKSIVILLITNKDPTPTCK